jgi:ABC-2 type transport system ATP-binding protein
MTNHPISINVLTKVYRSTFGKQTVGISDVSFDVSGGEVVGLIGQNGAGKTTTLKILLGFMKASAGRTSIFGVESANPESRRHLGYVPESAVFYDFMTPFETVFDTLRARGLVKAEARRRAVHWLDKFGIADAANRSNRLLSKGMGQRLALAQAMAGQPRLLVLDEPLSGLDPSGRMLVVDALQEYRAGGGSILFSSHVLYDVERLADRFVMIDRGRVRADMKMRELDALSTSYRVRSRGTQPFDDMRQDGPQQWIGEFSQGDTDKNIVRLIQAGHSIVEVSPIMALEDVYRALTADPGIGVTPAVGARLDNVAAGEREARDREHQD